VSVGAAPRGGTVQRWTLEVPRLSADLILRLQNTGPARVPPAVREIAEAVAARRRAWRRPRPSSGGDP